MDVLAPLIAAQLKHVINIVACITLLSDRRAPPPAPPLSMAPQLSRYRCYRSALHASRRPRQGRRRPAERAEAGHLASSQGDIKTERELYFLFFTPNMIPFAGKPISFLLKISTHAETMNYILESPTSYRLFSLLPVKHLLGTAHNFLPVSVPLAPLPGKRLTAGDRRSKVDQTLGLSRYRHHVIGARCVWWWGSEHQSQTWKAWK